MKAHIAVAAVFVLLSASIHAEEFTCQLENGKYVSVFVEHGKPPVYRYGTLAKTEITLPVPQQPNNNVFYGHQMFVAGASPMFVLRMETIATSFMTAKGEVGILTALLFIKTITLSVRKSVKSRYHQVWIISKIMPSKWILT